MTIRRHRVVPRRALIATCGPPALSYTVSDSTAGITTGGGNDNATIGARLDIVYSGTGGSAAGAFLVPPGASDGTDGWLVNSPRVAKYINKAAPNGPTQVRTTIIKPGHTLSLAAKGVGDIAIDIFSAGTPVDDSIFTAFCVANAGELSCHCSRFTECVLKVPPGRTEARITCTQGVPDETCVAAPPPICGNGALEPTEGCDGSYFPNGTPSPHGTCRTADAGHDACTFCGDGLLQAMGSAQEAPECAVFVAIPSDACPGAAGPIKCV